MHATLEQLQDLFAALGERVRLRLACCLAAAGKKLCVCELSDALEEPQPNVSRHLKLLKSAGLVEEERDGRWIYYGLKEVHHPLFETLRCCLDSACCCEDLSEDLDRLKERLKLRKGGKCVVGFQTHRRPRRERR